jgi:hypothetical protein
MPPTISEAFMGAVAAIIMRRQRETVRVFETARATTPDTARDPGELGVEEDVVFRGLVRRAVLRDAGNGRYYLDQLSWEALRSMRHRMALVVIFIAVLLGVFTILASRAATHG